MFDNSLIFDCHDKLILVVEDDYDIGDIIEHYLTREGMRVLRAMNGKQALEILAVQSIDLLLLDIKLPEMNGWDVLKRIRQYDNEPPVIMLTALDQDIDKVMALRMGADDFVVKPFNPNEVVARVVAVLRRTLHTKQIKNRNLRYKNLLIKSDTRTAYMEFDSKTLIINLTLTEYRILTLMIEYPHKVFTRSELINQCMPDGNALERTLDSHVSKLRKKLEEHGLEQMLINVRGVGYRLDHPQE
ncbi:efflux system response regulator transcription factor AdeR [Acinetobacter oleivorans]|uniref:efflux system response regulator transcription factor AdeR n=1 Tax=Acinetobacter oleivorans TaxID=1148157 RepID=UPI0015808AA8|nr:efflux system response regulator transcription factor AdeR [Acinetobacter oleivorans]NUF31998.1 efflux system response regulator transcription factor AdeR [Acinetobacter oleivorans]